jgi:hypothetical protein
MTKNKDKKKSPISKAVIVAVLLLAVIVLFPRRKDLLDGGTVRYSSIGMGAVYEIECRHRLHPEDGKIYNEVGTIISIFKKEIYNNVHVDYEHWTNEGHSPEVEAIDSEIESILNSAD